MFMLLAVIFQTVGGIGIISCVLLMRFKPDWCFKKHLPVTQVEPEALKLAQSYLGDQWEDIPQASEAMAEIMNPLLTEKVTREKTQAVILSTWIRGYQAGRKSQKLNV